MPQVAITNGKEGDCDHKAWSSFVEDLQLPRIEEIGGFQASLVTHF